MNQPLKEAITLFSEESRRLEKAYKALQKEFHLLRKKYEDDISTIVSHLSEGLIFISKEGIITHYNLAAEKITNYSRKKALNQPYWECFQDRLFGFSMREALLKNMEKELLLHWNQEREVEISVSSLKEKGVVCILRDVTDIQRLRKSAEHNHRMRELGEMGARLAHEIRNPLGGIEGFARLLCSDLQKMPELAQMAKKIVEGAQVLGRLVSDILDYARPCTVHFSTIDLSSLIEETLELVAHDPSFKTCFHKKEMNSLKIIADKDLLKLSLLNLLKNGSEAAKKAVAIKIKSDEKDVKIEVQDDGEGILPEHLDLIFTPFFTTKPTGTGLGLSEVHKMITAMGGKIQVESIPKKGSTFTIELPRSL